MIQLFQFFPILVAILSIQQAEAFQKVAYTRNLITKVFAAGEYKIPGIELTLEEVGQKWKLIQYGQGSTYGVESADKKFSSETIKVVVSQKGGIGISLSEFQVGNLNSGLVLIDEIFPGSNAEKTGALKIGDSLISFSAVEDNSFTTSVEGLNFDSTIKELKRFSEFETIALKVKRLVQRKEITVQMYGPQGKCFSQLIRILGVSIVLS